MRPTVPFLVTIVLAPACAVPDAKDGDAADDTDPVLHTDQASDTAARADTSEALDSDTGAPEPPVPHTDTIRSFAMAMEVAWIALDPQTRAACAANYGTPDCACDVRYEGVGVRDRTEPLHARFRGDWRLVESVCWEVSPGVAYHDALIWRPTDETAEVWHTVRWSSSLAILQNWVTHGEPDNDGLGPPTDGNTTYLEEERFFRRSGQDSTQRIEYDAASMTARFADGANSPVRPFSIHESVRAAWVFSTEETPPDARGIVVPP